MNRGERERLVFAPYGYCNISAHKIFLLLYNRGRVHTLGEGDSQVHCHYEHAAAAASLSVVHRGTYKSMSVGMN